MIIYQNNFSFVLNKDEQDIITKSLKDFSKPASQFLTAKVFLDMKDDKRYIMPETFVKEMLDFIFSHNHLIFRNYL